MSDERLIRIEDKIDKIDGRVDKIDVTLGKQHEVLKEHIRRTNLLEADVLPIKKHVERINGVIKFFGFISLLTGMIVGAIEIIKFFKG